MKENRTIILHFHIYKNAGKTFDWILEKNFGESFSLHSYEDPEKPLFLLYPSNDLSQNQFISLEQKSMMLIFPVPHSNTLIFPVPHSKMLIFRERNLKIHSFLQLNLTEKLTFQIQF